MKRKQHLRTDWENGWSTIPAHLFPFDCGDLVRFKKTGNIGEVIEIRELDIKIKWDNGDFAYIHPINLEEAEPVDVARYKLNGKTSL